MRALVFALCLCGCGFGPFDDGQAGGNDNLPVSGAGPYRKPGPDFDTPADEPYLVADNLARVAHPTALLRDDGGLTIVYAKSREGRSELWITGIGALSELPDRAPALVLEPVLPWHQDVVTEPSLVVDEVGRWILFYRGGVDAPAIGRAISTDEGATWMAEPEPILEGASSPGLARHGDRWFLSYTRADEAGIFLAESSDPTSFPAGELVVSARRLEEAFDRDGVGHPSLLVRETLEHGLHLGLVFTGYRVEGEETFSSLGYAGAFEGEPFERYLGLEPIVDGGLPSEEAPMVVLDGPRALLLFHEARRIAVAISP